MGVATKDKAKQDKAIIDLVSYARTLARFSARPTPTLPKNTVADLVKDSSLTLKDVVDAQALAMAQSLCSTRSAYHHMQMIGDPLVGAIVKQFPSRFPGSPDLAGVHSAFDAEHGAA